MADNRRITRSQRKNQAGGGAYTEAQFWNNVPDPTEIERGRSDAISTAYAASHNDNGVNDTAPQATGGTETTEVGNINEVTNYTVSTATSAIPPLTYVNDDGYEGLEEQFLSGEELSEDEVPDITENRVVTPQGMEASNGPLNPRYTQPAGTDEDLDVQPSQGPKNTPSLGDALNAFMDDKYSDIL